MGKKLDVQKVVYGVIERDKAKYEIKLYLVSVLTGEVVRKHTMDVHGPMKDVMDYGMMKATRGLIGSVVSKEEITRDHENDPLKRRKIKTIVASSLAAVGVGTGGASIYFWIKKGENKTAAENELLLHEKVKYEKKERDAFEKAGALTGAATVFVSSALITALVNPKGNKRVSVNGYLSRKQSALALNVSF